MVCFMGWIGALTVLLAAFVTAPVAANEWQIPAQVQDVTDGDTLRVIARPYPNMFYHDKVRLLDLDTPEIHHAKCDRERQAGEQAKARAIALLADRGIYLRLNGKRDSLGRLLAHVQLSDGRDFAQTLIAENLGRPTLTRNWCDILS